MSFVDVFWHFVNFALPAAVLSLGVTALGSWQNHGRAAMAWQWRWLCNGLAGLAVLAAGLVWTGRDGRMLTYSALVMVCASVEWLLSKRWRA